MDSSTGKQIKSSIDSLVLELRSIRKLLEKLVDDKSTTSVTLKSEMLDPIAVLEEIL